MNDASHYLDYEPQNIIPEFKSIVQTSTLEDVEITKKIETPFGGFVSSAIFLPVTSYGQY